MKKKILFLFIFLFVVLITGCVQTTNKNTQILKITGTSVLEKGETTTLRLNDYDKEKVEGIEWVSTNDYIATVTNDGVVTGVGLGSVIIIVRDTGDSGISARISILVVEKKIEYTTEAPEKISIIGKSELNVDEVFYYRIDTEPVNSSQDVEWISSDEEIFSVRRNGSVTANKEGTAVLTCRSIVDNAIISTLNIKVNNRQIYSNYEEQVIETIENTKNSILGVGNYSLTKDGTFVIKSIGSCFVYNCFPYSEGKIVKTFDNEVLENANEYYYYVITNRHVIEDADKITIYLHNKDIHVPADLIGYDSKEDIAVLGFVYSEYIKPLNMISTDSLKAGQTVIAIGNPNSFDFSSSATLGIISYPERYYYADIDGDGVNDWDTLYVQHDAAINPGNSGGPLLNIYGDVVGINTMKFASSSIDNMGFSIPTSTIQNLLPYIENYKTVNRVTLGIQITSIQDLLLYGSSSDYDYKVPDDVKKGLYIVKVEEESLAEKSGLVVDDIIVKVGGDIVRKTYDLRKVFNECIFNGINSVEIEVIRNGETKYITINF